MGGGIGSGGGATMHPGAPVIWPEGKKSEAEMVQQARQAQQAGKTSPSISGSPAQAAAAEAAQAAQAEAAAAAATSAASAQTVARPMNMQDIVSQLLEQGIRPTQENRQLAGKMLEHGLELSQENFSSIFSLTKGRQGKPMGQEAAILSLTKGLEGSPRSVDMLSGFLAGQNQVADQLKKLNDSFSNLAKELASSGKDVLDPELQSSLSGLVGSLQEEIKKMPNKFQDSSNEVMRRSQNLKDSSIMKQLLGAIEEQLAQSELSQTESGQKLLQSIRDARSSQEALINNITSQAILSKDNARYDQMHEKYYYWQIPNSMGEKPKTMEILVKGDETKKKSPINPRKTRVIIKLETDDLGEVTIFIDVAENNVWYMFNSETDEVKNFIAKNTIDLKSRMQKINYSTQGVQVIKKKVEIKKYIMPTIDLDDLTRVSTEV